MIDNYDKTAPIPIFSCHTATRRFLQYSTESWVYGTLTHYKQSSWHTSSPQWQPKHIWTSRREQTDRDSTLTFQNWKSDKSPNQRNLFAKQASCAHTTLPTLARVKRGASLSHTDLDHSTGEREQKISRREARGRPVLGSPSTRTQAAINSRASTNRLS